MDYDYMLYPEYHEHIRRESCSDLTRGLFGDSVSCEFCKSLGKKNQFDKLLSVDSKGTTNCRSSRLRHLYWLHEAHKKNEGNENNGGNDHRIAQGETLKSFHLTGNLAESSAEGGQNVNHGASRGCGFGNRGPKKVKNNGLHGKKKGKKQTAKSIPSKDGNNETNTTNEEKDDYVKVDSYDENEERSENGWTLI